MVRSRLRPLAFWQWAFRPAGARLQLSAASGPLQAVRICHKDAAIETISALQRLSFKNDERCHLTSYEVDGTLHIGSTPKSRWACMKPITS